MGRLRLEKYLLDKICRIYKKFVDENIFMKKTKNWYTYIEKTF